MAVRWCSQGDKRTGPGAGSSIESTLSSDVGGSAVGVVEKSSLHSCWFFMRPLLRPEYLTAVTGIDERGRKRGRSRQAKRSNVLYKVHIVACTRPGSHGAAQQNPRRAFCCQ